MYFCDCKNFYSKPTGVNCTVTFDFLNVFFFEGREMRMYIMPLNKLQKGFYFYIQTPSINYIPLTNIFWCFFSLKILFVHICTVTYKCIHANQCPWFCLYANCHIIFITTLKYIYILQDHTSKNYLFKIPLSRTITNFQFCN